MTPATRSAKLEYGDFQTPPELANRVCQKLVELGVNPLTIIEPTCGTGAFIAASASFFPSAQKIIGIEVNASYLDSMKSRIAFFLVIKRLQVKQGDFFTFDWKTVLKEIDDPILVLGNFPWVTNAQQGVLGSSNLPPKINFPQYNGLDALTGKSNFDISEWMLIEAANWLHNRKGYLAMLCKTSVARKFLNHLYNKHYGLSDSAIYGVDALKYFDASVDACLLVCAFDPALHNYDYHVFANLESDTHYRVGYRNHAPVRDLDTFEKYKSLYSPGKNKWRSGIKHDCSNVMEFRDLDGSYINGLHETVDVEPICLFPLLKGSDIANNRVDSTTRYMLVTQKSVGESTSYIRQVAPRTWDYLEAHATYLDYRKSKIYRDNPRFSVFGVGSYTFAPWKVAICGLYKTLNFQLVGPINDKPVVFDDTVYFLSFNDEQEARRYLAFLTSSSVKAFLSSLIFWDEKRPIKSSILNSLDLSPVEKTEQPRLF